MAKFNFSIRSKNVLSNVYVRLIDGRSTDIKLKTDILVDSRFWDAKKGFFIELDSVSSRRNNTKYLTDDEKQSYLETLENVRIIRDELEQLQKDLLEDFRQAKLKNLMIDRIWFENSINKSRGLIKNESDYLVPLMEQYRDSMKIRKESVSPLTLMTYTTVISRVKRYQEKTKTRIHIKNVDLTFCEKFIRFLKENEGLASTTISKTLKQMKTVIYDARDKGIDINSQALSRKFAHEQEKTLFTTVNEHEISLIKEFKGSDYLENAKDWFIIGCWTGCRVTDLMALNLNNIHTTLKGQKFIRYVQTKTGKQVDIPLHKDVIEIIEKRNGFPRPISDQRFNEYIKEVCKYSGLTDEVFCSKINPLTKRKETGFFQKWELIRSHTCRRSFATIHYEKLPNKVIMSVTGHSTEQMLLKYIGETDKDHLDDFFNLWDSDKEKTESEVLKIKKTN